MWRPLYNRIVTLSLLLLLSGCLGGPATLPDARPDEPTVDVAILQGKDRVRISGKALLFETGGRAYRPDRNEVVAEMTPHGFNIDRYRFGTAELLVSGEDLRLEGRPYGGRLKLIREGDKITLVNSIGLEMYLMGVINHEISSKWPIESVKAQAVAARTYAYRKIKSQKSGPYHLVATVMDQVYGGRALEDDRARLAVNETRGEVLHYGGEVANALFHSSCGGHTEWAANVWGDDYPYLRGVKDDYCTDAPNYYWTHIASYANIFDPLKKAGYPLSEERHISILERNRSGRVEKIRIAGVVIPGVKFREFVGYDKVKSTLFSVESDGDEIRISGSGAGHGAGLCQWGGRGMAEKGHLYRDILKHYYRGTTVRKIY